MNEYSFLLRDSRGVYTIANDRLTFLDYEGDYEDYNYGFFDVNEILKPNVYNELETSFDILICERNISESAKVVNAEEGDAEQFEDRFSILYHNAFVLPNGDTLPLDCDKLLLPKSIVEYSVGVPERVFKPTKIKDDGIYSFYFITIDRAEWVNISKMEAIKC